MRALAVIGASYGDEGKGRTVDWLAAPHGPAATVVRSNGGAQAGHTVVGPGGARHVFHHFGAATLRGSRTHLSRFMVSHPILFAEERERLIALGADPRVSADPRGAVTTPWDMMINQAVELSRGDGRHGSCGLGFGEAVGRGENTEFALTVADLAAPDLRRKLLAIRDGWVPGRIAELGLDPPNTALRFAAEHAVIDRFIDQCRAFANRVEPRDDARLGETGPVIFEAAQGLLLDQHAAGFPFVTRSSTGLANIAALAREGGITEIEPHYATRCYLTRHGRGPMEDERPIAEWFAVDDPTNRPNPWQETLRFGLLDPARLAERVAADAASVEGLTIAPKLVVTCLDQARGDIAWLADGSVRTGPAERFIAALTAATGLPLAAAFPSPANRPRARLAR